MDPESPSDVEDLFQQEARRRMERVRAILAEGFPEARTREREELWRHVHSLHGTASSLGHERIGALSADIATRLGAEGMPGTRDVPPEEQEVVRTEVASLDREVAALGGTHP